MPRRQFKNRFNPEQLADHFVDHESITGPIDSKTCFGNDAPLELEIGTGKGLFLAATAPRFPDRNFVGIEIIKKYALHAAGRVAKTGCKNVRVVSGDAGPLVKDHVAGGVLDAIHVYFPDPWWKKKHRRRRVVSLESTQEFFRVLRPGGRLHFWTDVLDYFEDTIEMIAETCPGFGVPIPESAGDVQHDLDYRTHFERRSRKQQIPVYRVRYVKQPETPESGLRRD
ncbi:MAG: tRNA (guanosine(46)-N7)-methyltransferase TrmB [Planctomycetota bacterium]